MHQSRRKSVRIVDDVRVADWEVAIPAQQRQSTRGKSAAAIFGPPCGEVILLGEIVIHLHEASLIESRGADVGDEIVGPLGGARDVRSGPELQEGFRDRIPITLGNERQIGGRGYARTADLRSHLAKTFVGTKRKQLVFHN